MAADLNHLDRAEGRRPAAELLDRFDLVDAAGKTPSTYSGGMHENHEFATGLQAYFATAGRPENASFTQLLLSKGLQQPDGVEPDLGAAIGTLRISDREG
jgi:hypothetical protein